VERNGPDCASEWARLYNQNDADLRNIRSWRETVPTAQVNGQGYTIKTTPTRLRWTSHADVSHISLVQLLISIVLVCFPSAWPATSQTARDDIRTAVSVCIRMASLRFGIAELAEKVREHPEWDSAAVARDIHALLDHPPEELPESSRSSHYS
jgi:hypothetical protein